MVKRLLACLAVVLSTFSASAVADADGVVRFATLPEGGPRFPEGIAADTQGRIYVSTFDFERPNAVYVFDRNGHLDATIPVPGVPLGLEIDAAGNLYVANFGGGNVLKYSPSFALVATIPVCEGPMTCGLNALAFDPAGNLYVSDSFGGRIFQIIGGASSLFLFDGRLRPGDHGFPPFGANGLAFDAKGVKLYVANTADDRILRIDVATRTVEPNSFAESINGADGITFDAKGRLWVAANQADEVVALNGNGRPVERVGSFEGIGRDLAAKGLLFPASIVISRGFVYVTNLALALTAQNGDEPEEDVRTYTVSRFRLPN
jgi:sugar lactone lactonase YvrE